MRSAPRPPCAVAEETGDRAEKQTPRRSPLALADTRLDRNHVRTDARGIDAIITSPLATGGAHVDAASSLVVSNPNDDVVSESEPTTSLACLDATSIRIGCNDGPSWHRFRDVKRAVERLG